MEEIPQEIMLLNKHFTVLRIKAVQPGYTLVGQQGNELIFEDENRKEKIVVLPIADGCQCRRRKLVFTVPDEDFSPKSFETVYFLRPDLSGNVVTQVRPIFEHDQWWAIIEVADIS